MCCSFIKKLKSYFFNNRVKNQSNGPPDFKSINYKNHIELFELSDKLKRLKDEINDVFNSSVKLKLSEMPIHKKVFLYLYNKSLKTFDAIYLLCLEGYPQDASILLRSLLENLISTKYILYDLKSADNKAARFEEYMWIEEKKLLEYWKEDNMALNQELKKSVLSHEEEVLQKVADFKKRFGVKRRQQLATWSGISIRDMAKEVEMLSNYLLTYRLACIFSHSSFLGATQSTKKSENRTMFMSQPTSEGVIAELKEALFYFSEFLRIFIPVFDLKFEAKLKEIYEEGIKIFDMDKYSG